MPIGFFIFVFSPTSDFIHLWPSQWFAYDGSASLFWIRLSCRDRKLLRLTSGRHSTENYNLESGIIICEKNLNLLWKYKLSCDQIIKIKRRSWSNCFLVKRRVLKPSLQFINSDIVQKKSLSLNLYTIPIWLIFFIIAIVAAMKLIRGG